MKKIKSSAKPFLLNCLKVVLIFGLISIAALGCLSSDSDDDDSEDTTAELTIDDCDSFGLEGCDTITFKDASYGVMNQLVEFYWGACDECGRARLSYDISGCLESIESLPMVYTDCDFIGCTFSDCTITSPLTNPVNDIPYTDNLLAYYPFEGSLPYNGDTLIECACFSEGRRGGSLSLHGEKDIVQVTPVRPQELTIAAWVYLRPQITENCCPAIYFDYDWEEEKGYRLYYTADGDGGFDSFFAFQFFDENGNENFVHSPGHLAFNQWHHVAVTYDGSLLALYYDGSKDLQYIPNTLSAPSPIAHNVVGSALIGGENLEAGAFNGKIDDLVIYDRALTAAEIRSLRYDY